MISIKSALIITALSLPLCAFAQSGSVCSGSACTTVDTSGLLAVGAGENPGISMSFGNAVNSAFNGSSGNGDTVSEQEGKRKDVDTKDK